MTERTISKMRSLFNLYRIASARIYSSRWWLHSPPKPHAFASLPIQASINLKPLGLYISMIVLVFITFKLPLIGIFKVCTIYYMSPFIAGLSSCLIFIMLKCYSGKADIEYRKLSFVFILSFTISFFILVLSSYINLPYILDLMALPFSIAITVATTPEGFRVIEFSMDSSKSADNSGASSSRNDQTPSERKPWHALMDVHHMRVELVKVGDQLNYFINKMVEVQAVNNVKVFQDSKDYITLDIPSHMSDAESSKIVSRVRIIATAFEDQCTLYESIVKKGMETKQECVRLGGSMDKHTFAFFDEQASKLSSIKEKYYQKISVID